MVDDDELTGDIGTIEDWMGEGSFGSTIDRALKNVLEAAWRYYDLSS